MPDSNSRQLPCQIPNSPDCLCIEAGLILKVSHISAPKIPLSAYAEFNIFKIYLADVGLLGAMAHLEAKTIILGNDLFQEFKGALVENFVAQELAYDQLSLYYWTSSSRAEIDFIVEYEGRVYPLEVYPNNLKNWNFGCAKAPGLADRKRPHISNIRSFTIGQSRELSRQPKSNSSSCLGIKAGCTTKKKSLKVYEEKYSPDLMLRISPMNLSKEGKILNCPLYLLESVARMIASS